MKRKKVVIVEDIESNLIFLENLITANFPDYEVVKSFTDGKYAIEYLNDNSDILLFWIRSSNSFVSGTFCPNIETPPVLDATLYHYYYCDVKQYALR